MAMTNREMVRCFDLMAEIVTATHRPRHYPSDLMRDAQTIAQTRYDTFYWILREGGTHLYPDPKNVLDVASIFSDIHSFWWWDGFTFTRCDRRQEEE